MGDLFHTTLNDSKPIELQVNHLQLSAQPLTTINFPINDHFLVFLIILMLPDSMDILKCMLYQVPNRNWLLDNRLQPPQPHGQLFTHFSSSIPKTFRQLITLVYLFESFKSCLREKCGMVYPWELDGFATSHNPPGALATLGSLAASSGPTCTVTHSDYLDGTTPPNPHPLSPHLSWLPGHVLPPIVPPPYQSLVYPDGYALAESLPHKTTSLQPEWYHH
ncbi:hypothetical protein BC827DRAFT_1270677 [Russula dissimulans]|nr:hypothetical protein BC827DRAFT_1270677 [Russula dissimulans]